MKAAAMMIVKVLFILLWILPAIYLDGWRIAIKDAKDLIFGEDES